MSAMPDGTPPRSQRASPATARDHLGPAQARAGAGITVARLRAWRRRGAQLRPDDLQRARTPRQSEWIYPLIVIAAVILWIAVGPSLIRPQVTSIAVAAVAAMFIMTIIGMRWVRRRFGLNSEGAMSLPNPLYALYLMVVILLGGHIGVALALIAPVIYSLPEIVRRTASWEMLLRQSCVAALGTLLCTVVYGATAETMSQYVSLLQAHILAAALAAAMMLVAAAVMALWPYGTPWHMDGWRSDLGVASFRFQALMLLTCPLFPLADMLRGTEVELAWMLLLLPLYVMYYLSLMSMRLEQRTAELQRTVYQLRAVRRREVELTNYAALITHAQEEERRRLARELHDDTAQALIALSRGIDTLAAQAARDTKGLTEDRSFIDDLSALAKRTLDGIRRACQNLRPAVLDDLGLAPALESLVGTMTDRGLPCEWARNGAPRPCPPEVEVTIYRIAQEALSNVQHHAQATRAWVTLTYAEEHLILVVRDDGHGFDTDAVRQAGQPTATTGHTGLGLLGMRERAALLGAELAIHSVPPQGTEITLNVPLAATLPTAPASDTSLTATPS